MGRPNRYSPEVRERSGRLVLDQVDKHSSQWAAIESVASKIGCTAETFRKWVHQSECENRELKRSNEILRKASAYSAQAELDRQKK